MKEKKKMNTYLKLGLIMLASAFAGGVLGCLIVWTEGGLLSIQTVVSQVISVIRSYILAEMLVLLLVEVLLGEIIFKKMRYYVDVMELAEDEEYDRVDYEAERLAAWGSSILILIEIISTLILATVYSLSYMRSISGEYALFLGAIAGFLCIYIYRACWGVRLVKLEQEINPERKGDPASMKFTEQWVESCDEGERERIYQSAYKSYLLLSKCVPGMMFLALMLHLIWNTGIVAVIFVGFIWMLLSVSYLKGSVRKKKEKLTQ